MIVECPENCFYCSGESCAICIEVRWWDGEICDHDIAERHPALKDQERA